MENCMRKSKIYSSKVLPENYKTVKGIHERVIIKHAACSNAKN